ncbi:MAG: dTDP-4-dehydrorhamnose 3,5-epimerase [bacterium]|nr:dTDP-4-dehydrorhamnose 3,5-epimerase [bacterium]
MTTFLPTPTNELSPGIHRTKIDGLLYTAHRKFDDDRGFYAELGLIPDIETHLKRPFKVAQVNQAHSVANVIRGFHAEAWNKLVFVTTGQVFCALADIRPESGTFGEVETFLLGHGNSALAGSLFISEGIANSVCVVSEPVDYVYFVDQLYRDRDLKNDQAISLFDPDLAVKWPLDRDKMIISDRDLQAVTLRSLYPDKF